jgi:outer membrane protein insertion porin family
VGRETVSNALTKVRKQYQKRDRLEATTTLRQLTYNQARKQVDYDFNASQGPLVKVVVEGAKLSHEPAEAAGADLPGGNGR